MSAFRKWFDRFADSLVTRALQQSPDFIVGGREDPYLLRWYLLGGRWVNDRKTGQPRWISRTVFGIRPYLHCFLRSDDDRALHDHPAPSLSVGLRNGAVEHTIAAGGVHYRRALKAGQTVWRSADFAHRIEIESGTEYWTLFIFFPNVREWGFHCKNGWVPWRVFTAADDSGSIGRGCGEP